MTEDTMQLNSHNSQHMVPDTVRKHIKQGNTSPFANVLAPLILLTTLTSNVSGPILHPMPHSSVGSAGGASARPDIATLIWEEAGIGLCCGKYAPPDG